MDCLPESHIDDDDANLGEGSASKKPRRSDYSSNYRWPIAVQEDANLFDEFFNSSVFPEDLLIETILDPLHNNPETLPQADDEIVNVSESNQKKRSECSISESRGES